MHTEWLCGDRCPVFVASHVEACSDNSVDDAAAPGWLTFRRCFGEHDDPSGMLDDIADVPLHARGLGPERLTVSEAVGHEVVVEARINAIGFVERRIEPHVSRGLGPTVGGRGCGPPDCAGPRVQSAQTHQRVDDDHVRSGLQNLQRGALGSRAL